MIKRKFYNECIFLVPLAFSCFYLNIAFAQDVLYFKKKSTPKPPTTTDSTARILPSIPELSQEPKKDTFSWTVSRKNPVQCASKVVQALLEGHLNLLTLNTSANGTSLFYGSTLSMTELKESYSGVNSYTISGTYNAGTKGSPEIRNFVGLIYIEHRNSYNDRGTHDLDDVDHYEKTFCRPTIFNEPYGHLTRRDIGTDLRGCNGEDLSKYLVFESELLDTEQKYLQGKYQLTSYSHFIISVYDQENKKLIFKL